MLLFVIILISHIRTSQSVRATPGHPVPHAEILDDLLSKFLGDSYSNSALFDFILGEPNQNKDAKISAGDNLDINILDVDSVRKIINFAKNKHENGLRTNSRRNLYPRNEAYAWHFYICNKTLDLMKQSIYMTQEKVNHIRMYRKKYKDHASYQIALLYGAAAAMLGKMESLISQQKHLPKHTHFIWFLILYEKILAVNIDISDTIEKLFKLEKVEAEFRKPDISPETMLGMNLTNATKMDDIMQNPEAAAAFKKQYGDIDLKALNGPQ